MTEHTAPGVIVEAPLRQKLRIPNVQRHHTGTYQCNVANKIGRETRQFTLSVIGKSLSLGNVYYLIELM